MPVPQHRLTTPRSTPRSTPSRRKSKPILYEPTHSSNDLCNAEWVNEFSPKFLPPSPPSPSPQKKSARSKRVEAAEKLVPVGTYLKKNFGGNLFVGKVVSVRKHARYNKTRRVLYEDNDVEDITAAAVLSLVEENGECKRREINKVRAKIELNKKIL